MLATLTIGLCVLPFVGALPQGASSASATAPSSATSISVGGSITISTAVASPTLPLSSPIPSQVELPPTQPWCPSEIFCSGAVSRSFQLSRPLDSSSHSSASSNSQSREFIRGSQNVRGQTYIQNLPRGPRRFPRSCEQQLNRERDREFCQFWFQRRRARTWTSCLDEFQPESCILEQCFRPLGQSLVPDCPWLLDAVNQGHQPVCAVWRGQ